MNLQSTFKRKSIETLRGSNFIVALKNHHMVELKQYRLESDGLHGRNLYGRKSTSWKPYLLEIISQATTWPPREKIFSMSLYPYLSSPVIDTLEATNRWSELRKVPLSYFKPEFYANCIRTNSDSLSYLPSNLKRESGYHEALRFDGLMLNSIPYEKITIPMCEIAVEQNGLALQFVPVAFKNLLLCRTAVEQNPMSLNFVPSSRITHSLCHAAVNLNGAALKYVPPYLKTEGLCKLAVRRSREAMAFLPARLDGRNRDVEHHAGFAL